MTIKLIPAGAFKQGCLAILDEVAEGNVEIVVTKRGRPVARLLPVGDPRTREEETLSRLRARVGGSIGRELDLISPTSAVARWKLLPGGKRR
jgi:prevent-host-death family protein